MENPLLKKPVYQCRKALTRHSVLAEGISGVLPLTDGRQKPDTDSTWHPPAQPTENPMRFVSNIFKTLVLAFCFSQMALAAEATVNINTADAATLDRVLVGIGPSKAQAIVAHRKAHGAFKSVSALADVKGIGPATLARNSGRITVGGTATAKPAAAKKASIN